MSSTPAEIQSPENPILANMPPVPGPGMAVGPRSPVGLTKPVGPVESEEWKRFEEPLPSTDKAVQKMAAAKPEPHLVQLDPVMVLKVELLATRRRANTAEEKLAILALQEARRTKQELDLEEKILSQQICKQLNVPSGKNIRLIDKDKGICQVE